MEVNKDRARMELTLQVHELGDCDVFFKLENEV